MDQTEITRTDGGTPISDPEYTSTAERGGGTASYEPGGSAHRLDRPLFAGLAAMAVALAANALAGPLVAGLVSYPFSETLVNQTVGLEAVTLAVVVPWTVVAAVLVRRGHRAGPILAVPPSAYTVYMFVQYVLGPEYLTYRPVVVAHLAIFVAGWVVLALAWRRARTVPVPDLSARRVRATAAGLVVLAAFISARYLPAAAGVATGAPISAEFAADPTMYWSIVLLDLGVVVPATAWTAAGLLRGAPWARTAVYGVVGWYVLVPLSVAAMSLVMLANDDPNAAVESVAVLGVAALLFVAFAAWVARPIRRSGA